MKRWWLLFVLGIVAFFSVCSKKEYRIAIVFTCPQGKEVKHGGYYRLHATGDSVSMYGYTPSEYAVTILEDDTLFGCCWKDTVSTDSLFFELYVNGESQISGLLGTHEFSFQYIGMDVGQ